MTDVTAAIIKALTRHGGWITALTLRDQLPNGTPRGEAFDVALGQLIATRRVLARPTEDGTSRIYRLSDVTAPAPTARIPVEAPGPAQAVTDAFHPPAPTIRVPTIQPGDDELTAPRQSTRPQVPAAQSEEGETDEMTMTSKGEEILELLKQRPMRTAEIAKAIKLNEPGTGYHLKELAKTKKIGKPDGRLGPWAIANGKGHPKTPAPRKPMTLLARPSKLQAADLRWSIRNDGMVTFINADGAMFEVHGETLDRVNAARQAIAAAA